MFSSGVISARLRASSPWGLVIGAAFLASACADPVALPLDLPLDSRSVVFAADDTATHQALARFDQKSPRRGEPVIKRTIARRTVVAMVRSASPMSPRVQRGGRETASLALGSARSVDPMRTARNQRRAERRELERLTRAMRLAQAIVLDSARHTQAYGSWVLPAEPDPRRLPTRGPPRA
jgi:hypothetical protein